MSPSGAEVLRQIKSRIDEVDPSTVHAHSGNGTVLIDVRETEEWSSGHIPGATTSPRATWSHGSRVRRRTAHST